MQLRYLFLGVLVGATFVACDVREDPDPDEEDAGCIGACQPQPDAGPDAGPGDAGNLDAGMVLTLTELRALEPAGQRVIINDVIVHSVFRNRGPPTSGCPTGTTRAEFWVLDPNNPDGGAYLEKFCAGSVPTNSYTPDAGDIITIDGYYRPEDEDEHYHGYRPKIADKFAGSGAPRLRITYKGKGTLPAPIEVGDAGEFGNAEMGTAKPNEDRRGQFVHINGPLEIIDAYPQPLFNMAGPCDGGNCLYDRHGNKVTDTPDGTNYRISWAGGFMVTGGILVADTRTRGQSCGDLTAEAGDGGMKIVFENGISGAWDTYTQEIFCSPFPACIHPAYVPGANDAGYTMVLYPTDCVRDFGTITKTAR